MRVNETNPRHQLFSPVYLHKYVCAFVCVHNDVCLHAFLIKSSVIVYEMLVADDEFLSAK